LKLVVEPGIAIFSRTAWLVARTIGFRQGDALRLFLPLERTHPQDLGRFIMMNQFRVGLNSFPSPASSSQRCCSRINLVHLCKQSIKVVGHFTAAVSVIFYQVRLVKLLVKSSPLPRLPPVVLRKQQTLNTTTQKNHLTSTVVMFGD
jgi:hypothetical protein